MKLSTSCEGDQNFSKVYVTKPQILISLAREKKEFICLSVCLSKLCDKITVT